MLNRRLAILCASAFFLSGAHAFAAEKQAYTEAAFAAAQAADRPILVDVTASWCPTCKAQRPIIESLSADPKAKNLLVLEVDFDTQTEALKKFNVRAQSTLITFKGKKETSRTVGNTDRGAIAGQLATVIGG